MHRLFLTFLTLLLTLLGPSVLAQVAGGACSGSATAGPDANGNTLKCNGGTWQVYVPAARTLGARSAQLTLGTIYGPAATDGLLFVQGQLDGIGGLATVSVVAGTANPPTTTVASQKTYNSGSYYYGTVCMTVPIRSGEYYQIQCNGSTACGSGYIDNTNYYFMSF